MEKKKPRTIIEFYFEPGTENIETNEKEEAAPNDEIKPGKETGQTDGN